uniref:Methyl-accepting chemotaxis sensory transducer with Cache sensor n=1 Tax=Nitratidesulfovibrio vulgaris (strain DSM 19637 / Miyazaki F) TaxID=883 RepID=B8DPV4_NITV9
MPHPTPGPVPGTATPLSMSDSAAPRFEASVALRIIALATFIALLFMTAILGGFLPQVRSDALQARQQELQHLVQAALKLVEGLDAKAGRGEIPLDEARRRAADALRQMRYGNGDYFWINDDRAPYPTMVMHPTAPVLEGQTLDKPAYNRGTHWRAAPGAPATEYPGGNRNLFQAFVDVAHQHGEGLVAYMWPKPKQGGGVTDQTYPKESYIARYKPWGWIIGTGVYVDDLEVAAGRLRNMVLAVTAAILAVGCVLTVLVTRSVRTPLHALVAYARAVAAGDLDAQPRGTFRAELRGLKQSIASMVESLRMRIEEARARTDEAAEHARRAQAATAEAEAARIRAEQARRDGMHEAAGMLEGIAAAIVDVADTVGRQVSLAGGGADAQKTRVAESSHAMERMDAAVAGMAGGAAGAADTADNAQTKAREGAEGVQRVKEAVVRVEKGAASLHASMADLSRKADSIGGIMAVISDIADQTNLLALNAAIEAARAGDAGRGFAVVADEVRKLAEKTMNATREVGEAIRAIQEGTAASARQVDAAVEAVTQANAQADTAGSSLDEIVRLASGVSAQVRAVATSGQEQAAVSADIVRSLGDITTISEDTAQAMRDAERSLGDLNTEAQRLGDLVARFKEG